MREIWEEDQHCEHGSGRFEVAKVAVGARSNPAAAVCHWAAGFQGWASRLPEVGEWDTMEGPSAQVVIALTNQARGHETQCVWVLHSPLSSHWLEHGAQVQSGPRMD